MTLILEDIRKRAGDLRRDISVEAALHRGAEESLAKMVAEVDGLKAEAGVLRRVDEVLLQISSKVLGQSTDKVDKLLDAGLNLVFDDQRIEFSTEIDRLRGKTSARFVLKVDGIEAPIMHAFGGGVLVIAGLLLRVVVVMVLGLSREIVLDESLPHLSAQYVPSASKLLRKLARELGFRFLVVTHDPELAVHADRHYEARPAKGGGTEFHLVQAENAKAS